MEPHPYQTKGGIMPYWQATHIGLRLAMIAFTLCVVLSLMAIDASWASSAEIVEIVFASIWGGIGIISGMIGWIGQIDGNTRYTTQLKNARKVRGLPQHGSAYKAVATGEYVEIWEGNRQRADRYTDAWKVLRKFHAEEQNDEAMEYWNNLSQTEGAVMIATPEAKALANTLDHR